MDGTCLCVLRAGLRGHRARGLGCHFVEQCGDTIRRDLACGTRGLRTADAAAINQRDLFGA